MKKKIFGLLLVISLLFVTACSGNSKLKDIAKKFNEDEDVKQAKEYGYTYEAKADGKTLTVSINGSDVKEQKFEFKLDGDILSGEFNESDSTYAAIVSVMVIDAIGQVNGYKEGELAKTINDERALNYTLDKEGIEFSVENGLKFKINIDKKIPLLDFSSIYITKEDLEDAKEYLTEGSYSTSRGNIILNSMYYDNTYEIEIAENNKITDSSIKSLASFLEVVFNDAAVSYLNDNYSLADGSKEFAGIKIELDVKLSEDEMSLPSDDYKVMRVTVDKDAFLKAIK